MNNKLYLYTFVAIIAVISYTSLFYLYLENSNLKRNIATINSTQQSKFESDSATTSVSASSNISYDTSDGAKAFYNNDNSNLPFEYKSLFAGAMMSLIDYKLNIKDRTFREDVNDVLENNLFLRYYSRDKSLALIGKLSPDCGTEQNRLIDTKTGKVIANIHDTEYGAQVKDGYFYFNFDESENSKLGSISKYIYGDATSSLIRDSVLSEDLTYESSEPGVCGPTVTFSTTTDSIIVDVYRYRSYNYENPDSNAFTKVGTKTFKLK